MMMVVGKSSPFSKKSAEDKIVSSHDTQMTAEEPFNIFCMGPNRDVVKCLQFSAVHILV
jgi:hypothetical protein